MKILDSFLFSEVYEKELLLLKFMLEDNGIHEWLILENAYSFQGGYIGLNARTLIYNDERFQPYLHKINFIEKKERTAELPVHEVNDNLSYKVEYWQRDLAYDYFINNYAEEDWIMIADVDEMIDFSDNARTKELHKKMLASKGMLVVPTKRFWYDFDNEYRLLIGNVMCSKKYLLSCGKKLHELRKENRKISKDKWNHIVQFEYSSCYNLEFVQRKFYTGTHTGFTPNDLKRSLQCNHRPTYEVRDTKPENNKLYFFETIKLNATNAPKYVREHLAVLKTNLVDKNYKLNRRHIYPELFRLNYFITQYYKNTARWFSKKFRNASRKLKMEKLIYGSSLH